MRELELFSKVLTYSDPTERSAFLDSVCEGDPALRQWLEELVAAHALGALSPLDRSPILPSATTLADPPTEGSPALANAEATATDTSPPSPIERRRDDDSGVDALIDDRYRLLEVIGEGGMGKVYLAEQTKPVERRVALKLIRAGMDSRTVLARFDAERQALAMMDHPNIARIFDGGVTPSGRPFFVMEYVVVSPPPRVWCSSRCWRESSEQVGDCTEKPNASRSETRRWKRRKND